MRLVNKSGNIVAYSDDEKVIKRLKNQGYMQKELLTVKKEETPTKKEVKKNGNGKRKAKPQGNI